MSVNNRSFALVLLLVSLVLPAISQTGPVFVNRAPEQSFTQVYDGGWEHFVGGGVAVFDCNQDHFPDLYIAGGENPARLLLNRTGAVGAALHFEPAATPGLQQVIGAYPLDVDSDGKLDLFVLRAGTNYILRGLGDCHFESANTAWHFDCAERWSAAFAETWETG